MAALTALGREALLSGDIAAFAGETVRAVCALLVVDAVAILRFAPGEPRLDLVAAAGCEQIPPVLVLEPAALRELTAGAVLLGEADGPAAFPLPLPAGKRSAAAVPLFTRDGLWGVIAACDGRPGRFAADESAFLQAAGDTVVSADLRAAAAADGCRAGLRDLLTGLPNRSSFFRWVNRSDDRGGPAAGPPDPSSAAVVLLDLDDFAAVNALCGHGGADQVLIEAAARLSRLVGPGDLLARVGGDEFAAACTARDQAGAEALARRMLSAFDEPFRPGGREVLVSASAGIAFAAPGADPGQLLADAELAMRQAKTVAGPALVPCSPQLRDAAERDNRVHTEIRRARERGELRAVYQPVVDLADGTVRGVEALLRWRHPVLGDVPAATAVAAAERVGLSWELTRWIVGTAATRVAQWNREHPAHTPLRLAVNFCPSLFEDAAHIDELEAEVVLSGLDLALLDVELTETALACPDAAALAAIERLRGYGVRLAMDDFGTGYSSLVSLVNLPFDILKIDRSFVGRIGQAQDDLLIPAITGIARGRHLATVAEGIETPDQLAALIAGECDLGQGYLLARPMESADLEALTGLEEQFAGHLHRARLGAAGLDPACRTGTGRGRVLVVDDNPADRKLLRVLLSAAGYCVEELADPARFCDTVASNRPDLVLLDLRLGRCTGLDLIEQAGPLLDMPVVAVTGYPRWLVDQGPGARRFDGIVTKPVDGPSFLEELDWLIPVPAA